MLFSLDRSTTTVYRRCTCALVNMCIVQVHVQAIGIDRVRVTARNSAVIQRRLIQLSLKPPPSLPYRVLLSFSLSLSPISFFLPLSLSLSPFLSLYSLPVQRTHNGMNDAMPWRTHAHLQSTINRRPSEPTLAILDLPSFRPSHPTFMSRLFVLVRRRDCDLSIDPVPGILVVFFQPTAPENVKWMFWTPPVPKTRFNSFKLDEKKGQSLPYNVTASSRLGIMPFPDGPHFMSFYNRF